MSTPQLITQGDSMPTSLYQLEAAIVELFALRDEAEYEGDSQAVAVIDQEIQKWVAAELRKVDGVVSFIRETDARADIAEAEAKRLTDRAKVWRAKGQRVKDAALQAMQDHGITKPLHGNSSTLRIQKNGGKEPAPEITDAALVPIEYKTVRLTMSASDYDRIWEKLVELRVTIPSKDVTINTEAVRTALHDMTTCPECAGDGTNIDGVNCPRCEGSGTIPNSVPGARLVPRGEHLRIG